MFSSISVFAYEYPKTFWSVNDKYVKALETKDYNKIIEYGNQIINLMSSAADGSEKKNIIVTRYNQIGLAYKELGRYDESAATFQKLYNYAIQYGDEFYDYIKASKARVLQYTSTAQMYIDGGTSTYYGAKNEKVNGVLFGMCANGATRSKLKNESMVLTYQELGQNLLAYNTGVVRNAASEGIAVEFALNCPKEGYDIENIHKYDSYLKEISDMFKKYPKVPIYLRFAAEFDIWTDLTDAESFKTAFRHVSDYFKKRNSNVAMVWSPNQVSNWYIDINDFYPGDKYVDWVGISLYAQPYFLGDKNQSEENEIVFKTGINSDPVLAVKDIVETYGNRKPIMISESGLGHKLVKSGENTTDFALQRLEEYYSYLPMVYPQIKLIAYFDWYVDAAQEKNDFRLSTNSKLQNKYIELTKGGRFIQDLYSNEVDLCYRKAQNGTTVGSFFQVACYAHKYNNTAKSVTYFIDDKYVGMANEIPYDTYIDATNYSGRHTLKAIITFSDGQVMTTESLINIVGISNDITVEIDGDRIYFDQPPILYNDRTMVPLRKIFEELGARVTWDGNTQTAIGTKGDRTVKVTIGQKKMYVNGREYTLDIAPIVVGGRTLVPARAIAEGLGCDVDWNGRYNLVSITPKVFKWSSWVEDLPDKVDSDLYYIEEKEEYRYRTKEKDYFTSKDKIWSANLVDEEINYGKWSDWSNNQIVSFDDSIEIETRTQSSPKSYHYAHYCTGNISDSSNKYRTWDHWWHDECTYHDLGWFDSPLPYSEDSDSDYAYYVNGKRYRCPNTCYRWYLIETKGGTYTQYRSRDVKTIYTYWEWSDWSRWSSWDEEEPDDYYWDDDVRLDIDERTVYRYKEK